MADMTESHKKAMLLLLPVLLAVAVYVVSRPEQQQELAASTGDNQADSVQSIERARKENIQRGKRQQVVTAKSMLRPRKHQPRGFRTESIYEQATVNELLARLKSDDDTILVDTLLAAQSLASRELLRFVEQAYEKTSGQLRRDCFELLVGYTDPAILPVVQKAFLSGDEDLRRAALEALENVGSTTDVVGDDVDDDEEVEEAPELSDVDREQILAMLIEAFNDPDQDIRSQAVQTLLQLPLDIQIDGFAYAQESSYDDVRADVVYVSSTSANWDTLYIAIKALDDPVAAIRENAASNLDFYIGRTFASSLDALNWWLQNNQHFDEDLFVNDLEIVELVQPLPGM
ncbi:MAG: hypothetical protein WC340_17305 [Kiritimatiellia bacterium]